MLSGCDQWSCAALRWSRIRVEDDATTLGRAKQLSANPAKADSSVAWHSQLRTAADGDLELRDG
jgi:hypothetical protein